VHEVEHIILGDPRKGQLIEQLTGAGAIEVETAARMSVLGNYIVLAAAVLVFVDRKSRDRRPFAITDLAERVMGPSSRTPIASSRPCSSPTATPWRPIWSSTEVAPTRWPGSARTWRTGR